MAEFKDILYEVGANAVRITINRPEVFNAFRSQTIEELILAFRMADEEKSVNTVIFTGAGEKAFCTGGDQKVHLSEDGLYGPRGDGGKLLASADLDLCHGTTDTITWNGKQVRMYHYVLTADFPYSVSCFRGTPVRSAHAAGGGRGRPGGPGGPQPGGGARPGGGPPPGGGAPPGGGPPPLPGQ